MIKRRSINGSVVTPKLGALEYTFWAFLMIAVGRVNELIPGLTSIPLVKITLGIMFIMLASRWKQLPTLGKAAKPLGSTALWIAMLAVLLTPFSYWRGASIAFLYQELPILLVATTIAYKMSSSWRAVRGTLLALVLSGLVLARAALLGYTGGRAAADTMYDTNDLAYLLISVLPLAIGFALAAEVKVRQLMYWGIVVALLTALLLTSSRGGFLGLVAILPLLVFLPLKADTTLALEGKSTVKKKKNRLLLPLVGVVIVCAAAWPQLPKETRDRFATLVSLGDDYNLDVTNKKSRGEIWKRGVSATFDRPIGHGPRSFGMVDLNYGGMMMAPHNSFVQAAVELGVIGLILFIKMYISGWIALGRVRLRLLKSAVLSKQEAEQILFARMLQLSLVGNAVAGFFLTMAYSTVLWVLFGMCMASVAVANNET